MSLLEMVEMKLKSTAFVSLDKALLDAERMADQFKDVTPVPYSYPIERSLGLPEFGNINQGAL